MSRYRFGFTAQNGWTPDVHQRSDIAHQAAASDATAEFDWHMGGGGESVGVDVSVELRGRFPLEALATIVQALNSSFVYIAGWPPQMQSCTERDRGGMHAPPVAVASLLAVSMAEVAES